jgi:hypothetical protein
LGALQTCGCVLRAGLAGEALRAITRTEEDAGQILAALQGAGVPLKSIERADATLEDVFLALANSN